MVGRDWRGAAPSSADRARCRLCAGVGAVVCVGGAVASLDGEADLFLPLLLLLLLLQLFLQLLLLLEGASLHGVFRGHGGVAACPVLLQGGAPLWMCSAGVLQPLTQGETKGDVCQQGGKHFNCFHGLLFKGQSRSFKCLGTNSLQTSTDTDCTLQQTAQTGISTINSTHTSWNVDFKWHFNGFHPTDTSTHPPTLQLLPRLSHQTDTSPAVSSHCPTALAVSVYIQSDNPRACRAWITYAPTWNPLFEFFKAIALQSPSPPRFSPFCPFVYWSVSSITQKLQTRFPHNLDGGCVSAQNRQTPLTK